MRGRHGEKVLIRPNSEASTAWSAGSPHQGLSQWLWRMGQQRLMVFSGKRPPAALPWGTDSSENRAPPLFPPPFLKTPLPRLSLEAQGEASIGCQGNGSIVPATV